MHRKTWPIATAMCGALDLLYAFVASALMSGKSPGDVLRGVAAGPFGDAATNWGTNGALLGALTHFTIMGVIVAVGLAVLARPSFAELAWWKTGLLFGLVAYLVMYGAVLPLRFGTPFPNPDRLKLFIWLLPHVLCVGWPLALIARRSAFSAAPRSS